MLPHSLLMDLEKSGTPPPIPIYDNPNQHLSTNGMLITLGINIGVFTVLVAVFEVHRFYKQIYLKRLQKRFEVQFLSLLSLILKEYSLFEAYKRNSRTSHHVHCNQTKSQPSYDRKMTQNDKKMSERYTMLRYHGCEYTTTNQWCDAVNQTIAAHVRWTTWSHLWHVLRCTTVM